MNVIEIQTPTTIYDVIRTAVEAVATADQMVRHVPPTRPEPRHASSNRYGARPHTTRSERRDEEQQ